MAIHVQIDPLERTATLRGVHSLCAGESSEVILSGVPDADTPTLSLRVYRDASESVQVACSVRPGTDPVEEGLAPVEGRAALRRGTLDLRTSAVSEWASEDAAAAAAADEARRSGSKEPEARAAASYRRPDSAWLVVADSSRVWAACAVPFVLRPFDDALSPDPEVPLPSYAERAEAAAEAAEAAAERAERAAEDAESAESVGKVGRDELFDDPDSASPKVKASLLPSYVDDVLEVAELPASGESGKLYVVTGTNAVYRWSGSSFVEVSPSRDWSGELAAKRDMTDLSVDRDRWLLAKPDGSLAWLGRPDPQRYEWTGDGFTLVYETAEAYWGLAKVDVAGWVVDDSDDSPPDANRLEFLGSDDASVYRLVRGSRLALDTEIPLADSAVTRTSANPVKSSGIWSAIWGALTALPTGVASLYDWIVAQLAGKRGLDDLSYRRQDPSEGGWILHMDGSDVRLLPAGELTWTDTGSETEWTYNLKWIGQWHLAYVAGSGLATCVDQESPEDATELALVSTSDYETVVATATAAPVDDALALRSEVAEKQDELTPAQLAAANSGATAAKVGTWDGYAAQIAAKASAADLRYRIAEAEYSASVGTAGGYILADRTVNLVTAGSGTASIDIELPELANVGRMRDFYVRLTVSATSAFTWTIGQGESWDAMGSPPSSFAAGTYLYHISEVAAGVWHAEDMFAVAGKMPMYPMVPVTPSNGTLTVSPYTVAMYTAGDSAAAFTVGVGTGTSGVARDCELVIDCTATGAVAPTVTWPSNFHPRTDADDFACEAGVKNVYYISEYATGEFVVGGWQETTGGNA